MYLLAYELLAVAFIRVMLTICKWMLTVWGLYPCDCGSPDGGNDERDQDGEKAESGGEDDCPPGEGGFYASPVPALEFEVVGDDGKDRGKPDQAGEELQDCFKPVI